MRIRSQYRLKYERNPNITHFIFYIYFHVLKCNDEPQNKQNNIYLPLHLIAIPSLTHHELQDVEVRNSAAYSLRALLVPKNSIFIHYVS